MCVTRRLRRSAVLCALACTLAAPAAAAPRDQERYYASYAPAPGASSGALAQEQYYASYSEPRPVKAQDTATGRDTRLILALSIGGALALVAAAGVAGHRRTQRRQHAVPA